MDFWKQQKSDIKKIIDAVDVLQSYEGQGVGQETIDEIQGLAESLEEELKSQHIKPYTIQVNVGLKNNDVNPSMIAGLLSVAIMDNNESATTIRFFDSEWNGEPEQVLYVEFGMGDTMPTIKTLERVSRVSTLCNQDAIAIRWRTEGNTYSRLIYQEGWTGKKVEFNNEYFKVPK